MRHMCTAHSTLIRFHCWNRLSTVGQGAYIVLLSIWLELTSRRRFVQEGAANLHQLEERWNSEYSLFSPSSCTSYLHSVMGGASRHPLPLPYLNSSISERVERAYIWWLYLNWAPFLTINSSLLTNYWKVCHTRDYLKIVWDKMVTNLQNYRKYWTQRCLCSLANARQTLCARTGFASFFFFFINMFVKLNNLFLRHQPQLFLL